MAGTKYTADVLAPIVASSSSLSEVIRKLGLTPNGGNHRMISARVRQAGLDTSHFRSKRGRAIVEAIPRSRLEIIVPEVATSATVAKIVSTKAFPDAVDFVANGPALSGPKLVKRLLAMGWTYACAICGIDSWRGERLVLHLDHINGGNNDHRLENLRLLCPNCHSQTETYCTGAREQALCYTSGRYASVVKWQTRYF